MKSAITGGIGEGKSTVLGYFREAGFTTASADDIARLLFDSEGIQQELSSILQAPLPVSRLFVRQAMLSSAEARRKVNRLMHRAIIEGLLESKAEFFEVPLLIETAVYSLFDRVWVVTCGREEQVSRLRARGLDAEIDSLLRSQLPTSAKTPFADVIVRTNAKEETVKEYALAQAKKEREIYELGSIVLYSCGQKQADSN